MAILGQFRDLDRPDQFVWLRGFDDMTARHAALTAFYSGPVWKAHGAAASATMVAVDDVLLLRPAAAGAGLSLRSVRRDEPRSSAIVIAIADRTAAGDPAGTLRGDVVPALATLGVVDARLVRDRPEREHVPAVAGPPRRRPRVDRRDRRRRPPRRRRRGGSDGRRRRHRAAPRPDGPIAARRVLNTGRPGGGPERAATMGRIWFAGRMSGGVASTAGERHAIVRSPADVLRLVVAAVVVVVVLLVEWLVGDSLVAFASDLLRGLDAVPQWIVDVIVIGTRVLAVVVIGGGLCWTLYRRRWRLLISTVAAAALAVALFAALDWLVDTDPGRDLVETGPSLGPLTSDGSVSAASVAAVAGVLTAAAPWLSRRWREIGWVLVLGLSFLTFLQARGVLRHDRGGGRRLAERGRRARRRRGTVAAADGGRGHRRAALRGPALGATRAGGRRRTRLDPVLRHQRGRHSAVHQSARHRRAQRRSPVPALPSRATPRPRRRATVRVAAPQRRARGVRRAERVRGRGPHAAAARVGDGRAERVRARLRADRGQVARPPRTGGDLR